MDVFYFSVETVRTSPTLIAIFAGNAGSASAISGRLMPSIEHYDPKYSGAGLETFRHSGNPEHLRDALANATIEGIAGYSTDEGWNVLPVPQSELSDWLE